jgi:hypothetical protein
LNRGAVFGAIFFASLGAIGVFAGVMYLFSMSSLDTLNGGSCRAICGLGLIFAQLFGKLVGNSVAGLLYLVTGFMSLWVGYKLAFPLKGAK